MSDSKARLNGDLRTTRDQLIAANMQVIRLLNYVLNMQEDYPELPWPSLPDDYHEATWRAVA